jgi:tripartite-type tricarboxylate transporter receptor subunit TctC
MRVTMRRIVKHLIVALLLIGASDARAAWPERPVVLVVPFAAGGITDLLARLTAERLQSVFHQTFMVENQLGAAGVVAAERVARSAPDGYTLLFTPVFQVTMAPFTHVIKFDPLKDFAPIAIVASSPFVITVSAAVPASTLAEFIAYVKSRPGQVPYASAGAGSLTQVSSAVFIHSAGLDMIHVPYKGLAPAFTDLLGDAGRAQALSRVRQDEASRGHRPRALAAASVGADHRRDAAEPAGGHL